MTDKIKLNAEKRNITGKKVKKIRFQGLIPANIYGSNIKSQAIKINKKDFIDTYEAAGETNIIYLNLKGEDKTRPTLISSFQQDPVSRQFLHVDFRQVDLTQKITATIEIEIQGESPAEKEDAVIVTVKDSVEVEALPTDLPEKLTVDISSLEKIGDNITVKNLKINTKKVKLLSDEDEILVAAEQRQEEPEEPEEITETEETETDETEKTEDKPADEEKSTDEKTQDKKTETDKNQQTEKK